MAKISYIINKSAKRSGKTKFGFGGSGSGTWFQKIFKAGKEEMSENPSDIKDLVSNLTSDFDGSSESLKETRVEFEGSTEEIREFASWSVSEIKANADSLKDLANFARSYSGSLADLSIKIYRGFSEADKTAEENAALRKENEELKAAAEKKSSKKAE